ncbi:hypothetical protein N802_04680 [Knoellia sinensis KCTC 19936]|uniref:MerR family transcriptional regulator n=1 Tax=Knoellia sinensis KCTC 19936 TaxID=1385520 RepID=A0A0A0J6H3_9MICO|nr:hypothetical protein [Knoellia sinensis]KGN31196.1 hypothetical protein N802_04680 [Knoellia sinensis KCTC 19936]
MRVGTPLEWATTLGVGPDDLPAASRVVLRGAVVIDEAIVKLRTTFHGCPDPELEKGLIQLEHQMGRSLDQIEDLHAEIRKELD